MHLRMTGNLLYDAEPSAPYTRAIMGFDDEHTLSFVDPRRFGTGWLLAGQPELDAYLGARLGVEPFSDDFTGEHLHALARGSRAPVKAFLLDQRRIAGVGNIYADEALFRARVHPLREAGRLTRAQWALLRDTVREALQRGDRRERREHRRLPRPRRRARLVPGPLPRAPPRRRAVPALRRAGAQAARRRPRHVRLRALPAAPARRARSCRWGAERPRAPTPPRPAALLRLRDRLLEARRPTARDVALERLVLRPLLARACRACCAPCRR